jgi:hypothetical protein
MTNPTDPLCVGSTNVRGRGVVLRGGYAYITGHCPQVIDIADPTAPRIVGEAMTPGMAWGLAVAEDYLVVADEVGLHTLPLQCETVGIGQPVEPEPDDDVPYVTSRLQVFPNPFNPRTTITFTLARDERVKVGIYDLTGRLVRVLADRARTSGDHSLAWNGVDGSGREAPTGSYVVRLETGSYAEARKISLIR